MKIVFATHNAGKFKEMRALLADLNIDISSAEDEGVFEDVVEDGKNFEENAFKKAFFIAKKLGEFAIADDSGICIDALDGAPGIFSARWAGENASSEDIVKYTLEKMKDIPEGKRTARFESVAALVAPDGRHWFFKGVIYGKLPECPIGEPRAKLPYDVIFIPDGYEKSYAEMTAEEKNGLSHRAIAFDKVKEFLRRKIK